MTVVEQLVSMLGEEIKSLPPRFHSSFTYTSTGHNFTHPITLGLLSKIVWRLAGVQHVGIDFRLNESGNKFQPDLVGLAQIEPFKPILFVDYESPNSSDMRVPVKDVQAYEEWSGFLGQRVPYFIITTLPKGLTDDWQLRYTAKSKYNETLYETRVETLAQIRLSPFDFWYSLYRKALEAKNLNEIYFINIDGKKVEHITF